VTTAEKPHSLLFPITDGDDALAFAIPLQVIAKKTNASTRPEHAEKEKTRQKSTEGATHIFPEMTLNSPLRA